MTKPKTTDRNCIQTNTKHIKYTITSTMTNNNVSKVTRQQNIQESPAITDKLAKNSEFACTKY